METSRCSNNRSSNSYVLTVPMRNGNLPINSVFLKRIYVLTVPMRNGNNLTKYLPSPRLSVLTVPMRNGNKMLITVLL